MKEINHNKPIRPSVYHWLLALLTMAFDEAEKDDRRDCVCVCEKKRWKKIETENEGRMLDFD